MISQDRKNHIVLKNKPILFIFLCSLTLLNINTANGRSRAKRKGPSCTTLRSLARVYMAYGDYTKAQPFAERALNMARERNVSGRELCLSMIDLAFLYSNQGRLDEAEELCRLGLKLQKEVYGEKHPYVSYTLRTLASIYREQGEYTQAKSALDTAMAVMVENVTPEDPLVAPLKIDIAKLLVAEGNLTEAEVCYREALHLIYQSYGHDHLYTASAIGNLAELLTLQGRYTEAESLIIKAQTIQERVYGSDHHFLAPAWLTMASIHQAKGEHGKADKLIDKALAAVKKTGNIVALAKVHKRAAEVRATVKVAYNTKAETVKQEVF